MAEHIVIKTKEQSFGSHFFAPAASSPAQPAVLVKGKGSAARALPHSAHALGVAEEIAVEITACVMLRAALDLERLGV